MRKSSPYASKTARFVLGLMMAWENFPSTHLNFHLLPGNSENFLCTSVYDFVHNFVNAQRHGQRQSKKYHIYFMCTLHIVQTTWSKKVNLKTYVLFPLVCCCCHFWQGSPANLFKIESYFFRKWSKNCETIKKKKKTNKSQHLLSSFIENIESKRRIERQRKNEKRPNASKYICCCW